MTRRILFADDDSLILKRLANALRDRGYDVDEATGVQEVLTLASARQYDLAILDLMMPATALDGIDAKGGFEAGIALARRLAALGTAMKIVGVSQLPTDAARRWFGQHANGFWDKSELLANSELLARRVDGVFTAELRIPGLRSFIVHGHDLVTRDELVAYLTSELGMRPPVILRDTAWRGRTVIEKLEQLADGIDVVFVLMTPDDFVTAPGGAVVGQARPNVLVELGYFLGRMSRLRGHVIVVTRGDVYVPSDLTGVGYITLIHGISGARAELRRELASIAAHLWGEER